MSLKSYTSSVNNTWSSCVWHFFYHLWLKNTTVMAHLKTLHTLLNVITMTIVIEDKIHKDYTYLLDFTFFVRYIFCEFKFLTYTRWRSWLNHCALSRRVIGNFQWDNPSCRTMTVGSTNRMSSTCIGLATSPPSSADCLEIRDCNRPERGLLSSERTHCGPKILGLIFFKSKTHEENTYFFKFKIRSTGICTGFCAVVHFLKSCRKFLYFGSSLTHQLQFLGSQQHPQCGVLLTPFSTWGTENSMAEINLETAGGDKVL